MADQQKATPKSRKRGSSLPLLGGLLVALLVVVFFVADPLGLRQKREHEAEQHDAATRPVLVGLKRAEISAVEIDPPDDPVKGKVDGFRLEKQNDKWYAVQGGKRYKANMERVDALLDGLSGTTPPVDAEGKPVTGQKVEDQGLRADSLATSSPTEYDDMEVSDAKAIVLRVFKGSSPAVTLQVGKAAPGYGSSFVRLNSGKEVWRARRNVKALVGYTFGDYRTRKPWDYKPETATKLTVRKFAAPVAGQSVAGGGTELSFELKDTLWKHGAANGNQNAIKELLQKLSELEATEFADDAKPEVTKLANQPAAMTVVTPGGTYSLTLGAKDGSYWYVKDQDGDQYKVTDYSLGFYRELDFDRLAFDDTKKDEAGKGATKNGSAKVEPPKTRK